MKSDADRETEAYLARIRRTIAESNRLVEAVGLRMAETDRMLESQGLTREQVMNFRFTENQLEAVNRELVRLGMDPLEEEPSVYTGLNSGLDSDTPIVAPPEAREDGPAGGELAERQRKFGMMMKPFQI